MLRLNLIMVVLMVMSCSDTLASCNKDETLKLIGAGYTKDEISEICGQEEKQSRNQLRDKTMQNLSTHSEVPTSDPNVYEGTSPEEIFKELKSLVDYSRNTTDQGPYVAEKNHDFKTKLYLIRENIRMNQCLLISEVHWRAAGSVFAVDLSTSRDKQLVASDVWKIDLTKVDAEKTNSLKESKIVLKRGSTYEYLFFGKEGWKNIEELRALTKISRLDNEFGPLLNNGKLIEEDAKRSGEFQLGLAYPEDRKEIQNKFDELVRSCQTVKGGSSLATIENAVDHMIKISANSDDPLSPDQRDNITQSFRNLFAKCPAKSTEYYACVMEVKSPDMLASHCQSMLIACNMDSLSGK